MYLVGVLMEWPQFLNEVWKRRKDFIGNYVRQYLIKPINTQIDKWKSFRIRFIALSNLCGKYLMKKNSERQKALNLEVDPINYSYRSKSKTSKYSSLN
jgi:hypothetical protein